MKERLYSVLKQCAIFLTAGILYYLLITLSDYKFGFKCPLYELTTLKCPSCGVSRMIVSLIHLEFKEAFMHNEALFILLPVYFILFAHYLLSFIRTGKKEIPTPGIVIVAISGVILIAYGIMRNII